jgi:hypothetical protein
MAPHSSLAPGDLFSGLQGDHCPTITCFHGQTSMITQEFYSKQVCEVAESVKSKLANDLQLFLRMHQLEAGDDEDPVNKEHILQEMATSVSPAYPEPFASGNIINAFSPGKGQLEPLVNAIKAFSVDIVLVIEHEKLEQDIKNALQRHDLKAKIV